MRISEKIMLWNSFEIVSEKFFKSSMSKEGSKRFANSLKTKLTSKFLKSDVNGFVKMAFVIKNIRVRNFITRETWEGYFRCLECYFFLSIYFLSSSNMKEGKNSLSMDFCVIVSFQLREMIDLFISISLTSMSL